MEAFAPKTKTEKHDIICRNLILLNLGPDSAKQYLMEANKLKGKQNEEIGEGMDN